MLWFKKNKLKKALEANNLIHDAIVMSIFDKYYKDESLTDDSFESQLLARALNWAIPDLKYDIKNDLEKLEDEKIKRRMIEEENKIYEKGLEILNSEVAGDVATFYVAYEIYLADMLFDESEKKNYIGLERMRKFMFQSLDSEPDVSSPDFCEKYKELFIKFNNEYGPYGKVLSEKTIDNLFYFIKI